MVDGGGGGGGLINFLPLKRGGAYLTGGFNIGFAVYILLLSR